MREIKFRIWSTEDERYKQELLPGDVLNFNFDLFELGYYLDEDERDNYVFEQYTGLKDKNGKEIYHGDIVKTTDRVTVKGLIFPVGVVEFKQQAFWICNVPSERPDFTHSETLLQYWETDLEVIGNIHENPELLGDEK